MLLTDINCALILALTFVFVCGCVKLLFALLSNSLKTGNWTLTPVSNIVTKKNFEKETIHFLK